MAGLLLACPSFSSFVWACKNSKADACHPCLFDGHDAAINVMRRLIQSSGAEVIHLGHDRGADEVARAAIQEDAHCVAITSYQGGAVEMFTHTKQILDQSGFGCI